MKVKAVINFRDLENNLKLRKKDEIFEVSKERGRKLLSLGYVKEVLEKKQNMAADEKG
jgi:hypothetical protein